MEKSFKLSGQNIYEIALSIMLFYDVVIRQSTLKDILDVSLFGNVLWAIILCLLFVKILQSRYSLNQFLLMIIIFVVCIISSVVSNEITMIKFIVFAIGAINCDVERNLKCYIRSWVFWGLVVIALALIGVIPNHIYGFRYGMNRYGLGFTAPSSIGYLSFNVLFYYLSKNYKHIKLRLFVLIGALLFVLWYVVNCKTAIVIDVVMILCFLIARYFPQIFCKKYIYGVLIVSVFISVYFAIYYSDQNEIHKSLNSFLSLRPFYSNYYYGITGINWFGYTSQSQELVGIWLDNSYVSLLLRFGIVSLACIVIIYMIAIKGIIEKKDVVSGVGVLSAILYGLSEMTLYTFGTNIVLFIVVAYFWDALKPQKTKLLD